MSLCDDSLANYLTRIKGQEATLTSYNTSLQGSITGFRKVFSAISEYNKISSSDTQKQKEYCDAIGLTNTNLSNYLTKLNGSKAGMLGYGVSLVGATVKTVALQVATMALNAAITMGASVIISGIVTAISDWIRQDEILAEKAENAKQKIDELNNEYKAHSQLVSGSAKRYAELAQGVDQLSGKNLSLNDNDYKEFLDLSNQLAEAFPTLSRHYDENGQAILDLSGNVDTIVGSLNNLIEAERDLKNQQIADGLPTIYKNANNKSNDYENQIKELKEQRQTLIDGLGDVQSDDFSKNFMSGLESSIISIEGENLETLSKMKDDYINILKEANLDFEELTPDYENKDGVVVPVRFNIKINSSDEDIKKVKDEIKVNVDSLASEYEDDISDLNTKIQNVQEQNKSNWSSLSSSLAAWLNTEDSYKVMSDDMQSTVQNIVNGLDWSTLDFSSWDDAKQYIQDNILSLFQTSDGKETLKDIEVMFGIQTQFNNGEITVNEYQEKLQSFLDQIKGLAPETQKAIKLIFGIQTEDDGSTSSSVDTMVNNVKGKLKDEFDDKVGELTLDDLQIASKLEISEGTLLSWDELRQKIEEAKNAASDESPVSMDITSSVKQIATQLEPQFKQLGEAYKNIFTENGFTLDNVDNEMLENLRKSFGEIEAEVGVAFDTSQLNSFFDVLTNGKSTASQVQQEFNNLATSYLYSTETLKSLNESTANSVAKQLEELGVTNSLDLVVAALASKNDILAASKITLAETGFDVANATTEEVLAFIGEQNEASVTGQVLAYLQLQKQLVNNTMLDTAADINNIIALAEAAGMTTESLYKLESAKSLFESAKKTGDHMMEQKALQDMQAAYSSVQNTVANWKPTANYKGIGGGKSAASKAGSKSETDEYLENFEKMQDKLKDLYDQGKITTKQYYDALRALAEKYLKDREKYADKLAEIEQEYAKGMKELYDTVISGIISKIDKRISALNDQKDAAVSALEAEEKAAKKTLEAQKEALQVEIDAIDKQISSKQELIDSINDEADAKQRAYDLDKAQYELDRLRNQKTIYEYSGKEKGFIYKTDDKAIRDQEQEVDDKKREIRIANIEKEISALEKRKSALEEQQNAIDDQIDAISDYYEELIANTEAYWDEIIKGMEETKTKWEELQELQENAELEMNLRSLGYEGGIDEVLALTDEQFAQFKNNYLQYIAGMNQGNQSFIDSLSQISGVDIGNLPDIFEETQKYIDMLGQGIDFTNLDASLSGVISGFTKIADEAGIATGAIIGGTATTSANSSGNKNGAQGENGQSSSGSGDSLNGGIKTMSEESVPKINEVANAFAGSEEGEDTGTSVAGSAQKASKAISSGKDSGDEEDESLQGAIKTQVEAAVDEEEGIPKQTQAWDGLNETLGKIRENLDAIKTLINEISNMDLSGLSAIGGIKIVGGAGVDGTAFASGTLGKVSDNGVALGGELGREMVVRDGRFFTVGDNGAELFHHKKGDIIFNHKQTQDILKNGHTNSRGKAFAGGNVNGLPKEYSLPSQEVMDRMAKLEAGFNSLNRDESLLVQMQIRDNTKKIYEQNARAIQEVQKYNKSNSTSNTYNYSIDAIELPNVMNGVDFYRDIRRLNTLIKQQGSTRK